MSSILPPRDNGRVRVFLTGATGFVGGAMARALVHQGAEIHALVRPRIVALWVTCRSSGTRETSTRRYA